MNVKYVDAHCHLQLKQYTQDREEIIERMREDDIVAIVVGDDLESSKQALLLAEKHEYLFASVGVHPDHIGQEFFDEIAFHELAMHKKVVAIGECGLDYYRLPNNETSYSAEATKDKQKELFRKHIALAIELDKPLMIHARPSAGARDAYEDMISILKEEKINSKLRGNIHFFSGTLEEAQEFFALGFTISFTAVITFTHDYDTVIKTVPLTNILSETDAPFVAPASRRGERNDSLSIIEVVAKIAEIRGENIETVRKELLSNAERLFTLQTA